MVTELREAATDFEVRNFFSPAAAPGCGLCLGHKNEYRQTAGSLYNTHATAEEGLDSDLYITNGGGYNK